MLVTYTHDVGESTGCKVLEQGHNELPLSELLCEPLCGRLKRESKSAVVHTVLPLARVRTAPEVSRTAVGKNLGMALGVDIKSMAFASPHGPRPDDVRGHHLLVWLVQVLFLGGWAVLVHVFTKDGKPFVSLRKCMRHVREQVAPSACQTTGTVCPLRPFNSYDVGFCYVSRSNA